MTAPVSVPALWMVCLAGLFLTAVLCWLEWKRADGRHLRLRLLATFAATGAMTLLGIQPAWRHGSGAPRRGAREASVWTGTGRGVKAAYIEPILRRVPADRQFALLSVALPTERRAAIIPDLAYLRRHFPEVNRFHLIGAGLLPSELEALRGCEVDFVPEDGSVATPAVATLTCPTQVPVGTPLVVQGCIDGLADRAGCEVSLISPDGAITGASIRYDEKERKGFFEARSLPVAAVGRFAWRLRVSTPGVRGTVLAEDELGVEVVEPTLPRVLVLESSPHPDTAALRRWMEHLGGAMTVRTRVGAERYRFVATRGASPEFATVDAALLARFDLVSADPAALGALTSPERSALEEATTMGLGVLVTGSFSEPWLASFLSLGKIVPLETASAGDDGSVRLVRPQWESQARVSDVRIPVEPAEVRLSGDSAVPLVTDGQSHIVAAGVRRGQGMAGLTLVRDTWRWPLDNDEAAFAGYWSFLFSKFARSVDTAKSGRWFIGQGREPSFVDEPLELTWAGEGSPPPSALVTCGEKSQQDTTLALAQDADGTSVWRATFWPREAGWYHVASSAAGAAMNFFVDQGGWKHLREMTRRRATERFAALSQGDAQIADAVVKPELDEVVPFPAGWLFTLFVASAGFLWAERYSRLH